jgi:hypothetical protein
VEFVMTKQRVFCVFAALLMLAAASSAWATTTTGAFTAPLTSGLVLSVDINGGLASDQKPGEGWNGSNSSPAFFPDQYGVTWSPWVGSTAPSGQSGDGTVWPQGTGQAGTAGTAAGSNNTTIFNKVFGSVIASVSAPGTASQYGNPKINSRDRGNAPGGLTAPYNSGTTANAKDVDMFRDLIFGAGSGSNVQGTNMLQVQFSGLTPGNLYQVALYSFDNSSPNLTSWTATAPTTSGGLLGWWAASPVDNNTFNPPADVQTIDWKNGANSGTLRAPATFTLTANGGGSISVWAWGGDGLVDQSANNTYLNGFQLAAIPEASAFAMGGAVCGMIGLTYIARRNRKSGEAAA